MIYLHIIAGDNRLIPLQFYFQRLFIEKERT